MNWLMDRLEDALSNIYVVYTIMVLTIVVALVDLIAWNLPGLAISGSVALFWIVMSRRQR